MKTWFLALLFPFFSDPSATDIVKKAEEKLRGNSNEAELTITIHRPSWERTLEAKTWALGTDYSLILLKAPARDKGTVFLKREKEIWNWVPNIERTIKLPPSMMMQSWMGSDFNNDDLVQESSIVTDYSHTLKGRETVAGYECYVIEFTPKPDAAVVWGKIIGYISVEGYLQLKSEFYDEDGFLINVMEGSDVIELDGRLLPSKLRMTPVDKEGHYTEMTYKSLTFDVPLKPSFFTTQNMKRIRE
ncbi:MAG: outer membrane lipoprotein-sorting protein [Schleiferiaceae bacterium]